MDALAGHGAVTVVPEIIRAVKDIGGLGVAAVALIVVWQVVVRTRRGKSDYK